MCSSTDMRRLMTGIHSEISDSVTSTAGEGPLSDVFKYRYASLNDRDTF